MDAPSFENLRRFFERVKNVGFFERLFSWKTIVSSGYDAFGEYQNLQNLMQEQSRRIAELTAKDRELALNLDHQSQQLIQLQQDLVTIKAKNEELVRKMNERENEAGALLAADKKNQQIISQLKADMAGWTARYDQVNVQFTDAQKRLAEYRQFEEERVREHDRRVTELNALKKQLDDDRLHIQQQREAEIHKEYEEMEQTWRNHEILVEQSLRNICRQHNIDYCDKEKFPYSGKPDNAIVIGDQYIIFDAKSPKNTQDLTNFPDYIKNQTESVKKYVKGENVRKEIFLVVPANTVQYLNEFHYDMADWQVYVVTHDCIEPIVLALRKIEEYDFVDQLSPEDRENICRIIGKFAHATKRRIQIDNYFSNEFIGLLQNCSSLPEEIKDKVVNYEKAEKMNPPIEKRKKLIPIKDLEHDVKVIEKEAEAREIDVTAVTRAKIENIPLDKFL
jgi:hypothetical protein